MIKNKFTFNGALTLSLILGITLFNQKAFASELHSKFKVNRIAGLDRYETSVLLSRSSGNNTADNVILTTGEDFPDSLCAAPLAAKLKAPILLTNRDGLSISTREEILRLKPKNIYIIGGQGAVGKKAEDDIRSMNINVNRIGGIDRYETSMKVANLLGSPSKIFVVTGENFPDALSVGTISAKDIIPIILTNNDGISNNLQNYLNRNAISESYVIGGPAVISDNISKRLPNCTRIYGDDRYSTNIKIINQFSDELDIKNVYLSTGENFPDALSCAWIAGLKSSPIIISSKTEEETTREYFKSINSFVDNVNVLGGESVVPSNNIDDTSEGANAQNNLSIPTYEGSKQACHPKVLYFPNGWNGWKYWMSMTPYPDSQDSWENPSIVVSNSGTNWKVPKELKNPISPLPQKAGQHNSDPTLIYNDKTNELELWYRFTLYDKEDQIYRVTSTNGINWSNPQLMSSFYNQQKCLSPAIILENNGYKMWYINEEYKCMFVQSNDGLRWSNPVEVNLNLDDSYVPWHIDVVHTDLGYETVFCGFRKNELYSNNRILFWNISNDGLNFENSKVILRPSISSTNWDDKQIYKSTFVKVDGIYKLFYSAMDKNYKWHIGLTQGYDFDNLHGYEGDISK